MSMIRPPRFPEGRNQALAERIRFGV